MLTYIKHMQFSDADIEIAWSFLLLLAFWIAPSLLCYGLVRLLRWLVFWYHFKNATISVDDLSLEDLRVLNEQTEVYKKQLKKLYAEDDPSDCGCHGSKNDKAGGCNKAD